MLQKLHRYDLEPDEYLVRKLEDGRHKALEMIRKIVSNGVLLSAELGISKEVNYLKFCWCSIEDLIFI